MNFALAFSILIWKWSANRWRSIGVTRISSDSLQHLPQPWQRWAFWARYLNAISGSMLPITSPPVRTGEPQTFQVAELHDGSVYPDDMEASLVRIALVPVDLDTLDARAYLLGGSWVVGQDFLYDFLIVHSEGFPRFILIA